MEETAELLQRGTVQKLFRGYYFDKYRTMNHSTRYMTPSVNTTLMIETMAKEARSTWADEGEIPDIDVEDHTMQKEEKQKRLELLLKKL